MRDAGAKVVVVEDDIQRDKVIGLRDRLLTVTGLVQITGSLPPDPLRTYVQPLADLRTTGRAWLAKHPSELDEHGDAVTPESTFTIIYTSGTTGVPKGVVLTHDHLTAGVCSAVRAMEIFGSDVHYISAARARSRARARVGHHPHRLRDGVLARHPQHQRRPGGGATYFHGRRSAHLRKVLWRREGGAGAGLGPQTQAGGMGPRKGQRARRRDPGGEACLRRSLVLARRQAGARQIARAARPRSLAIPRVGRRAAGRGDSANFSTRPDSSFSRATG